MRVRAASESDADCLARLLRSYLDETKRLPVEPELHIQPDPYSRYARVDEMLAVIKRSEVTKVGFVDNEKYANFTK